VVDVVSVRTVGAKLIGSAKGISVVVIVNVLTNTVVVGIVWSMDETAGRTMDGVEWERVK
jgi:hypothetical protein